MVNTIRELREYMQHVFAHETGRKPRSSTRVKGVAADNIAVRVASEIGSPLFHEGSVPFTFDEIFEHARYHLFPLPAE